jgi:hypothetical protein
MSFRMRNTIQYQNEENLSDAQKEANRIDFEQLKLKQYGDKYLYNPLSNVEQTINYQLEGVHENNELVFDRQTDRWIIVKESEIKSYKK